MGPEEFGPNFKRLQGKVSRITEILRMGSRQVAHPQDADRPVSNGEAASFADGTVHLGKASFTPPSTGRMAPVVFEERSDAKKRTASATSWGRIRVLSRFRLA